MHDTLLALRMETDRSENRKYNTIPDEEVREIETFLQNKFEETRQRVLTEMKEELSAELLKEIRNLEFGFDNAIKPCGMYYRKTCGAVGISLSRQFIKGGLGRDFMVNILLHEFAHALTPDHNHDDVWRAMALRIGCDGKTSSEIEDLHNIIPPRIALRSYL